MSLTDPTASPAAPGADPAQDITERVTKDGVRYLFAQFVDLHAKPNAKLVPVSHLDDMLTEGAGFAGFAAGEVGQRPHDPDLIAVPDARSYTPLPWRPEVARFACDLQVDGVSWPYCPRTILRSQLERASALGFEFRLGAELEYFLVRRRDDGSIEVADAQDTLSQPCYDMRALTRGLDFVTTIADHLSTLGWDNYATDHEDANGQFEQNFAFADALTTCDRAIFFRYMVESIAQERGLIATFMPKPFSHLTGNGCHFHMSLWRDGVNLFELDPAEDPRGPWPVADRVPLHRRPQGTREGVDRPDRAHGHLLQAPGHRRAQRLGVGADPRQLRLQQPHPDAAHSRAGAHRGSLGRRLVQPLPGGHRRAGRRPGRDRTRLDPG